MENSSTALCPFSAPSSTESIWRPPFVVASALFLGTCVDNDDELRAIASLGRVSHGATIFSSERTTVRGGAMCRAVLSRGATSLTLSLSPAGLQKQRRHGINTGPMTRRPGV
jgi:hypothetical protein